MSKTTISLTFGDAGENHVGMEMVGNLSSAGSGFTCSELQQLAKEYTNSEYHSLNINQTNEEAGILIIRNFIEDRHYRDFFNEINDLEWDTKYFDNRRKKVLNKLARSNLLFLDGTSQDADYENGKGTIYDSLELEMLAKIKRRMVRKFNGILKNNKCDNLICEGNKYSNIDKCGIGFHGDAERRKVIAIRLGETMPIVWQWFHRFKPVGNPFTFNVNGGDLYIMSEKAVGNDWKKSSIYTLRHAAGCDKYTNLRKYN